MTVTRILVAKLEDTVSRSILLRRPCFHFMTGAQPQPSGARFYPHALLLPAARAFSTMANPKVFFDVAIGGRPAGRIEFEVRAGRALRQFV